MGSRPSGGKESISLAPELESRAGFYPASSRHNYNKNEQVLIVITVR
jgi:hypothetical protein